MSDELRVKTSKEIRDEFFNYIFRVIDDMAEQPNLSVQRKLYLLAFSMMNNFDGTAGDLSFGLLLVPTCHSTDPDYHRDNGGNWYPVNEAVEEVMESELSGGDMLHDAFCNHPSRPVSTRV